MQKIFSLFVFFAIIIASTIHSVIAFNHFPFLYILISAFCFINLFFPRHLANLYLNLKLLFITDKKDVEPSAFFINYIRVSTILLFIIINIITYFNK